MNLRKESWWSSLSSPSYVNPRLRRQMLFAAASCSSYGLEEACSSRQRGLRSVQVAIVNERRMRKPAARHWGPIWLDAPPIMIALFRQLSRSRLMGNDAIDRWILSRGTLFTLLIPRALSPLALLALSPASRRLPFNNNNNSVFSTALQPAAPWAWQWKTTIVESIMGAAMREKGGPWMQT